MFKKFLFLVCLFISCDLFAVEDCSEFKFNPDININNINNDNVIVEKSEENLVGKLGYVKSSITYNVKYIVIPISVKDGFCLSLRSVDVDIKFPEFDIVIDKRLKEDTCAYNIVLQHEKDHIQQDKDVIYSNLENIKKSVLNAVESIKPVFVENGEDTEKNKIKIYEQLTNHKDVVDIISKIKQELRQENEKIDLRGDSFKIWQCEDFYKEMKDYYDKISID